MTMCHYAYYLFYLHLNHFSSVLHPSCACISSMFSGIFICIAYPSELPPDVKFAVITNLKLEHTIDLTLSFPLNQVEYLSSYVIYVWM